jgi:predicted transcriptional regulator
MAKSARTLANMMPLSDMLRIWRETLQITRAEAARRCKMSQVQWTELETAVTCDPRTSTLIKLADGTGYALERLAAASRLTPAEQTPRLEAAAVG